MTSERNWRGIGVTVVTSVVLSFFLSMQVYAQVAGATLSGSVADKSGSVISVPKSLSKTSQQE